MPYKLPMIIITGIGGDNQELNLDKLTSHSYPQKDNNQNSKVRAKNFSIRRIHNYRTSVQPDSFVVEPQYSKLLNDFNCSYSEKELSGYIELFFMKRKQLLQDKGCCSWFLHSHINQPQVEALPTKHRQILALLKYALKSPKSSFAGEKCRTFLVFEALQWIEGTPSEPKVCSSAPPAFHDMLKLVKVDNQFHHRQLNLSYYKPHSPVYRPIRGGRRW